jgi:hypothetical protein
MSGSAGDGTSVGTVEGLARPAASTLSVTATEPREAERTRHGIRLMVGSHGKLAERSWAVSIGLGSSRWPRRRGSGHVRQGRPFR